MRLLVAQSVVVAVPYLSAVAVEPQVSLEPPKKRHKQLAVAVLQLAVVLVLVVALIVMPFVCFVVFSQDIGLRINQSRCQSFGLIRSEHHCLPTTFEYVP